MPTTTTVSQTVTTPTTSTTTTTASSPLNPVAIIDLILADVNAVLPNFNGLVSSYRLLVGAAEEIHRTPGVCPDVFERAVRRYDNAGTLIDVLLELLCCKIVFIADLLKVTCGPVDLVRYLLTCLDNEDTPCRSAEATVALAGLRRLQDCFCNKNYCLPDDRPVVCFTPPAPAAAPPAAPPAAPTESSVFLSKSDIADIVEVKVLQLLTDLGLTAPVGIRPPEEDTNSLKQKPASRLRFKHLPDPYADDGKKKRGR